MNKYLCLVSELKSLRKGRGVFASRIRERVGPDLRVMCGIAGDDDPATIRRKLVARLVELADHLPPDLCLATVAAFALSTEVRLPLYRDRVHWAATKIDRDPRTVRRRVDDAIDQLAELGAATAPARTGSWHTAQLHVVVALDCPQPEVLELHRIVADQDAPHELELTSPLAVSRNFLEVNVLYGGTLSDRGIVTRGRPGFTLALPEPSSHGEHDFAVRYRLPDRHAMRRPYVVHVPENPCELFDLRVRFGHDWLPQRVWTLRDAHQSALSSPTGHGPQHPVDRAGEVHLGFRRLIPGLAYGVRWEADDQSSSLPSVRRACVS
jgi:hypothetical protein